MFSKKLLAAVTAVVSFAALPALSQLTTGCYRIAPSGLSGFLAGLSSDAVDPIPVVGLADGAAASVVGVNIAQLDFFG